MRVRWSGVAINATNRVHQCVFSPLSYWIYGGAAGDEYIWLFPTSAAMLDHPGGGAKGPLGLSAIPPLYRYDVVCSLYGGKGR